MADHLRSGRGFCLIRFGADAAFWHDPGHRQCSGRPFTLTLTLIDGGHAVFGCAIIGAVLTLF